VLRFDQTLPSLYREDDMNIELREGIRHRIHLAQSLRVSTPKMRSTQIVPNWRMERDSMYILDQRRSGSSPRRGETFIENGQSTLLFFDSAAATR
jgi:hypothetical protein